MSRPSWEDDPADLPTIGRNAAQLIAGLHAAADDRSLPTLADVLSWHKTLYRGCRVPLAGYVGRFRGDASVPELIEYEVGLGPMQPDGFFERMGLPSARVAPAVDQLLPSVHAALQRLDEVLPVGSRPRTVDELHAVVALSAQVHGEWVRIHPFANGNGRTARTWAAFIAVRYSLPVFVVSKPRPHDIAYARAARESMGRPPDYRGDHSASVAVFGHLLTLALLP